MERLNNKNIFYFLNKTSFSLWKMINYSFNSKYQKQSVHLLKELDIFLELEHIAKHWAEM